MSAANGLETMSGPSLGEMEIYHQLTQWHE